MRRDNITKIHLDVDLSIAKHLHKVFNKKTQFTLEESAEIYEGPFESVVVFEFSGVKSDKILASQTILPMLLNEIGYNGKIGTCYGAVPFGYKKIAGEFGVLIARENNK